MYLEQAVDAVQYQETSKQDVVFGYEPATDTILYNPGDPSFPDYDFRVVLTHELGHLIDHMFVQTREQTDFIVAIQGAKMALDVNPDLFVQFCKQNDKEGFLSDILDAISKGEHDFPMGHGAGYWIPERQAGEIFANLFALESYEDKEKIEFLKKYFPGLVQEFATLEFLI